MKEKVIKSNVAVVGGVAVSKCAYGPVERVVYSRHNPVHAFVDRSSAGGP